MDSQTELILQVDKRNRYSKEMYTKLDTDSFCFDDYLNETIEIANKIGYEDGLYQARILSVIREMGYGHFEEGYVILQEIVKVKPVEELSLKNRMKYNSCMMSYHSDYTGDLELAIRFARKELDAAYILDDIQEIMRIKMNIGSLNTSLKYFESAIKFLNETLEYYKSTKNNSLLSYNYLHLGEVYFEKEEYDIAKQYFLDSVELARKEGIMTMIQYSTIGLGKIEKVLKNYDQAILHLQEAVQLTREIECLQDEVEARLELFDIYMILKRYEDGLSELSYIEDNIEKVGNINMVMDVYKHKAEVCEKLGKMDLAYKSLLEYVKIKANQNNSASHLVMNNVIQEEHRKALKRLETIAAVGRELTVLSNIDDVLLNIKSELSKVLPVDAIGVGEISSDLLHFNHYFIENEKTEFKSVSLNDNKSLAAWCVNNREEVIINDLDVEYSQYIQGIRVLKNQRDDDYSKVNSLMYAPLKVNDRIIGVFTIQSYNKQVYSSIEVDIFQIIVDYVAIALINISQKRELERLSVRDNLTNMYNRRGFIEYYNEHVVNKKYSTISIIMLDLDFFKSINDKYGHISGDDVLRVVTTSLMEKEELGICTARLGGEEFGVIVFDRSLQYIMELAELIRSDIENLDIYIDEICLKVTTSVGVTFKMMNDSISYNQLYFEADNALYEAKEEGRNRVKFY